MLGYIQTQRKYLCPINLDMEQGKTLKDLIKAANLTYRELAKNLGTSPDQIVAWNQFKVKPTLPYVVKLAKQLNVSFKTLAEALGEDVEGIPDDCLQDDRQHEA
jgi:transcriptional regulator with XRE-family HTH domain